MSCYMLIKRSEISVQFTNADTVYMKPYYGLYHVLSSVYQSVSYSHTIALLTLNV
jgi:hypothetical protein